jgi:hypothetical protein
MVRAALAAGQACYSKWGSLQSEFSNNRLENSAPSKRLPNRRDIGREDTAMALCGM